MSIIFHDETFSEGKKIILVSREWNQDFFRSMTKTYFCMTFPIAP